MFLSLRFIFNNISTYQMRPEPFLSLFLTVVCALFVSNAAAQILGHDNDHYCNKAHAARNMFNPLLRNNPLTETYNLKYYRFEWDIDPAVYGIKGTATSYYEVVSDVIKEINFEFSNQLTIDSIVWHGQKMTYEQPSAYLLKIFFPESIASGSIDSLSISYHGAPPSGGFGSFVQDVHNGTSVLWTLSEPFGAQDWWPCKNGLNDKIDSIDVIITTPNTYRAASNGLLVSENTLDGTKKRFHWKHRYPIAPYLVAFAVTNYNTYTDDVLLSDNTVMPMLNYVFPEDEVAARRGTADNVKVLQYYDSLFVDYPFKREKYGHAQFKWGGGMEHQTMSFVINYSWGLLAHELAHQWFGDFVTCGAWEDIWLNEGFATYLEGLSRERYPQSTNDWYNWKNGKIGSIISQPGGSVLVSDPTSVGRIFSSRLSYNKGSYLLHQLRWIVGDELFFAGLRNYLNARAYNYATTEQLKSHLETSSGRNLTEYFSDWYEGEGYPLYSVKWGQANDIARLKIDQTTSSNKVDFYEMPVEILLKGQGKQTNVRLEHGYSGQEFDINVDFKVESVDFDPNLWIACKKEVSKDDLLISSIANISEDGLTVQPNPTRNWLAVSNISSITKSYRILDLNGRVCMSGDFSKGLNNLDVNALKSGTYIISVMGQEGIATYKFVKI